MTIAVDLGRKATKPTMSKRFCFDDFSALLDRTPKLSLTEEEIKIRAQSLTDTDLQDKQAGNNDNSLPRVHKHQGNVREI